MSDHDNAHTALGPGHEFDHIRALLDMWGPLAQGIGDDAAILHDAPGQLVISTDSTVENVHFRRAWMSMRDVGARGATAALSDIAAMGARAESVLISLIVPNDYREQLAQFAEGIRETVSAAGAKIVGGNISSGATFSCTFTVLGRAERPVLRSGGAPGDVLCVTGVLGGPAVFVAAKELGEVPPAEAANRFLRPMARLAEGRWLAEHGATAMMDISDGLLADARHLGAGSGLIARVEPLDVPRFAFVSPEVAATSGEEYELLVALNPIGFLEIIAQFEEKFGIPLSPVGMLLSPEPSPSDRASGNSTKRVELGGGHDHFSK